MELALGKPYCLAAAGGLRFLPALQILGPGIPNTDEGGKEGGRIRADLI